MAKIVVQHDTDPAIGIILEEVPPGTPGRAQGLYGTCTQCGSPVHAWRQSRAIERAKQHVDSHEAVVAGVDPSSVVPNPLAS